MAPLDKASDRPEFRDWVDRQPASLEPLLPVMHTAKALIARDIVRQGAIVPRECEVLGKAVAYFFYGRPAYRLSDNGTVTQNLMCPICFVFSPELLANASNIHPFDTGAFYNRLYRHAMIEDIEIPNFDLVGDIDRIPKLIARVFSNNTTYFDGDRFAIRRAAHDAEPDEYLAQSYIDLITSKGRNEPDDRVSTIEVAIDKTASLEPGLLAVVVPDNIWSAEYSSDWLRPLSDGGVEILPYRHVMGREPSHYRDAIEVQVRAFLLGRGLI
ncbi:hypothetical protein [Brevundimonas sp.]|uniref:hypothetical protein n=1 Tax=Brevundimonas sp. TaxID=1871086 RepID=UPI0025DBDC0B|nr:hypothetical protein [Brevundimonas sp.]